MIYNFNIRKMKRIINIYIRAYMLKQLNSNEYAYNVLLNRKFIFFL